MKSDFELRCLMSEMVVVNIAYRNIQHYRQIYKANDIITWLLENKIRHEMIYDNWTAEIPIAVGFETTEDATLFKLRWDV